MLYTHQLEWSLSKRMKKDEHRRAGILVLMELTPSQRNTSSVGVIEAVAKRVSLSSNLVSISSSCPCFDSKNLTVSSVFCISGIELRNLCICFIRFTSMNLYFLSQRLELGGRVREHFVEFAESSRDIVGGGEEVFYFVDERSAWDASRVGVAKDN